VYFRKTTIRDDGIGKYLSRIIWDSKLLRASTNFGVPNLSCSKPFQGSVSLKNERSLARTSLGDRF